MSLLLDYSSEADPTTHVDYGLRDGTVSLRQQIEFNPNKKKAFRVLRVTMSPEIPNVYSYQGIDNTRIGFSKDGGVTWDICQLSTGIFTVTQLMVSLNDTATQAGYWIDPTDPGFEINYNPATKLIYVHLDSTKILGGGVLAIDLSISQIYQMLGYPLIACTFVGTGLYSATLPPQMDFQGTYVDIEVSCIQSVRYVNGQLRSTICRIPISASATEIVFPSGNTGMISPVVPANIPNIIQSFNVIIRNGRGNPAVFLYGGFTLELEIMEI